MSHLNAQITTQAVIRNQKNEILLLKRNKPGGWFTLPGGTLEEGEDIKDCLKREIEEETGLTLEIGAPIWIWQSNHIGKDLLGVVFNVEAKVSDIEKIQLSPEHSEYKWFTVDELFENDEVDPYIKKNELKELLHS